MVGAEQDRTGRSGPGKAPKKAKGQTRARKVRGPDESKLTEEALREAALRYLDRYDASTEQLRQVLLRRVQRYGDDSTKEPARARIEELLARLAASRLVDDERFAKNFVRGQRGRGASTLALRAKLKKRGIRPELSDQVLGEVADDEQLDERHAALAYAKKRRLDRRYDLDDPAQRNKALAALARRGFSFDVAKNTLASLEEEEI